MKIKNNLWITGLLILLSGCVSNTKKHSISELNTISNKSNFGVVIMAHGGRTEWNQGVLDVVAPLKANYDIELAFGMADAVTIQSAVERLESRGVNKIAVVRMYVSGESWYQRTQKILGIKAGAPTRPTQQNNTDKVHKGHSMEFWELESNSQFVMSEQGLSEAPEMNEVLVYRAQQLSKNSNNEDLLIVAHGPDDDLENKRWIENISKRAEDIYATVPFNSIKIETLREDWSGKRQAAEKRIRNFVQTSMDNNRTVIVIPYRVQGFGPYTEVLKDLKYTANETGLVPHKNVTLWLERQIKELEARF